MSAIYEYVGGYRPTENPFWKEQVRKVLQSSFFTKADEAYELAPE